MLNCHASYLVLLILLEDRGLCSSKTSVGSQRTIRHYMPEDSTLNVINKCESVNCSGGERDSSHVTNEIVRFFMLP